MIAASLLLSLAGVIAAGVGTFTAFRGTPRGYTTLAASATGSSIRRRSRRSAFAT